tara:strand:- start:72604 stop:73485 length:882 start_codon:yes stop_codon:yes gene_type:complete
MGSKLLFYLIILPISKLPFWILYLLSDFLYLMLYRIIGYRTKVVRQNLSNSFPDKYKKDILVIEAKFYSHLCDLVVESIKAFSISLEDAKTRMKNRNIEVVNKYFEQGRQVVLVGGHYGNWELFAITIGETTDHKTLALYTPLKNEFINEKITKSRSKYGLGMLSITKIKSKLNDINSDLYAIIFGADQSPRKSQRAYWMNFLNQETGIQFGTEKFAKEFNAVVIFTNIYKVKRGYYELQYDVITEQPEKEAIGFISKTHTQMLENVIQQQPEYWLWSHKRWKHKKPDGEVLN